MKYIISIIIMLFSINSSAGEVSIVNSSYTAKQAESFVAEVADKAVNIIQSSQSESEKFSELSQLFLKNVDTVWMARFALGSSWRRLTETQKSEYTKLYQDFLIKTYVPNFKKYNSDKINITGGEAIGNGQFKVSTVINSANDHHINVIYMIHYQDNTPQIFDIIVEGVSLITTQRAEFTSIIQQNGFQALVSELQSKT
jgi:phospholipid transport system substrate-binding protein